MFRMLANVPTACMLFPIPLNWTVRLPRLLQWWHVGFKGCLYVKSGFYSENVIEFDIYYDNQCRDDPLDLLTPSTVDIRSAFRGYF